MKVVLDLQACQMEPVRFGVLHNSLEYAKQILKQASSDDVWVMLNDLYPEAVSIIRSEFDGLLSHDKFIVFSACIDVVDVFDEWHSCVLSNVRESILAALSPNIVHLFAPLNKNDLDILSSVIINERNYSLVISVPSQQSLMSDDAKISSINMSVFNNNEVLFNSADCLLTGSKSIKNILTDSLDLDADKVVYTSYAVDKVFKCHEMPANEKDVILRSMGINKEYILCSTENIFHDNCMNNVIEALSCFSSEIKGAIQLVMFGKVKAKDYALLVECLESYSLDINMVVVLGDVSNQELAYLFNFCNVFLGLPSVDRICLEQAMLCGAPIIGSKCNEYTDIITLEEFLVNFKSAEDVFSVLVKVFSSCDFRDSLKQYVMSEALMLLKINPARITVDQYEKLYKLKAFSHDMKKFNVDGLLLSLIERCNEFECLEQDVINLSHGVALNKSLLANSVKLFLDVSVIVGVDAKSGIQRVVRSLLMELLSDDSNEYDVRPIYYRRGKFYYADDFVNSLKNGKKRVIDDQCIEYSSRDIYLSLDLNYSTSEITRPILEKMKLYGVKLNFTVYDILLVQHPEWWQKECSVMFKQWLHNTSDIASCYICISRSVAEEVYDWLNCNQPDRVQSLNIKYFYLGADIENSLPTKLQDNEDIGVLDDLSDSMSFLMVGTIEPRKGHKQVLQAFEQLWDDGLDIILVIVGKAGWLVDDFIDSVRIHSRLNKQLFWFEGVSDEFLLAVYENSKCLIAASEGEGFGLPLIEAAQHKLPIIARDIPVFHEVAGNHALYFDGFSPESISDVIKSWIELNEAGNAPQSAHMKWLTWKESAEQLTRALLGENEINTIQFDSSNNEHV